MAFRAKFQDASTSHYWLGKGPFRSLCGIDAGERWLNYEEPQAPLCGRCKKLAPDGFPGGLIVPKPLQ